LWFDAQLPSGQLLNSPAPASSFYHLVGAIAALNELLENPTRPVSVKSAC